MQRPRQEIDPAFDDEIGAWFGGSKPISRDEMMANVFRFDSLPTADFAFIDAVVPGHERVLMGAVGGSDYKRLTGQVQSAEHLNLDFVSAKPGNGAALHSHDTEETFICLTGTWEVTWGDEGEERIELDRFDGVLVPAGVMRSFRNVSDDEALLMAIVGGPDPGHVVWANVMRGPLAG